MKKKNHILTNIIRFISGDVCVFDKIPLGKFIYVFLISFFFTLSGYAQHWDSLRGGINHPAPTCLYEDTISDKLYIGGNFKKADHKWINGIGSWDGNQWDSLGHGIDFFDTIPNDFPANTWAITRYGNYLYVGGSFRMAGNIMTTGFARWNGANWDTVPGGRIADYHDILSIVTYNNELYICGNFDSIGNIPASGIAKWNGTTWQAIGGNYQFTAQNYWISKMAFYHGDLYVGGMFQDPLGNTCRLAEWDGTNWQFFTSALQGGIADVDNMIVYNNELYVSGLFYSSVGNAGTGIIRWNDTIWRDVGGSLQLVSYAYPRIAGMSVCNGKLYCVGLFDYVGGINANNLATWDGTQWCGYGTTFDNTVTQVTFYNDTMYLGGSFWHVDGDSIPYIIKWIGGSYVDTCGAINTGINEQNNNTNSVLIYPNPVNENATFQFQDSQKTKTIFIYDQLGKEIWRKETAENQIEFSVEDLADGMYFYQVVEKDNIRSGGKFIVQH